MSMQKKLPKLAFLYLDHVMRFFDSSNFKGWPDKIEALVYHWGNDKQRFIDEVKHKHIDVLIGNIPATAYESFREIARALPEVIFVPSLDSQFANKSKENVTRLCEKYRLPIPKTEIFYQPELADQYLASVDYPKIIKKSYGPSNYGGYFVHKVDSYQEAKALLAAKNYYPVYVQDFITMAADIRVMLIGHKPVCAFWRRPANGDWLTNTSQGGMMDYQGVPSAALDLAVATSKAANAEYWACDIAVSEQGQYSILECACAFAAFPYIRDWIGQYLMWKLSEGRFHKPHIPLYHWQELGKIDSLLLRTMRHITFGHQTMAVSQDCGETFDEVDCDGYPLVSTVRAKDEEWPSEIWNRQDHYQADKGNFTEYFRCSTSAAKVERDSLEDEENSADQLLPQLTESRLFDFFIGVKGINRTLANNIMTGLGTVGVVEALVNDPIKLTAIKHIKEKKLSSITEHWQLFSKSL